MTASRNQPALAGPHPLDNPVFASLTGPHEFFARGRRRAWRYPPEVAAFAGFAGAPDPNDWDDLAAATRLGDVVILTGVLGDPPRGWEVVEHNPGVQLVDDGMAAVPDEEAVRLGVEDVPEMLALVAATRPGPFLPRTIELGTYLGIRHRGRLVAMAGERLHPPGWTEISAVCTDAAFRGRGLSTRLVHAVAHQIRGRGETPFLHAAASNVTAIRLYEKLGFRLRRTPDFLAVQRVV
ncbi:GNAT family N-acetyltransferase [Mycolicibacterium sp. 050158]|uniref:GNAT family N-acetyltransferase n=1 Tax=Mycolicibacterium sp. 050158 TaxID=3090602 RepID=UPI0039A54CA9